MTDISRHALLKQAYEVCQEIEKCGASPQLTNAVTKASELLRALDDFIPVSSEAKPQNGSTVKGYRTLSYGEVGKMNQFKELSRQFIALMREHGNDLNPLTPADYPCDAFEWCREAEAAMKKACMFACRAVARPDADC
ncbi:hypothetical protein ABIE06_003458 [Pantoea dispersa]